MVNQRILVNLFHIFLVAPLFAYIGYNKSKTPSSIFTFLAFVAGFVILYHAYRYYNTTWWINLMHVFIGASMLALSLMGQSLPDKAFYLYYFSAALVIIWHSHLIYTRLPSSTD